MNVTRMCCHFFQFRAYVLYVLYVLSNVYQKSEIEDEICSILVF